MKTTIIAIIALAAGFGLAYIVMANTGGQASMPVAADTQQYTCGMHPEIVTNEPGYCPICEMKLTPKKDGGSDAGTIRIDPTTSQNMGLVTTAVSRQEITKDVHAFGKVSFAEPNLHSVNVKFDGWVERLFVDREGDRVYRGQPLFEVYSPQLVAAQKEYLVALSAVQALTEVKEAALSRLSNWDISDGQIAALESSGEITRTLTVRAPADGIVVGKKVSEGDRVRPGAELYRIADLSTVWVVAQVYEQDLPFVREGQLATLDFPNLGGDRRQGTVSYVAPFLDSRAQVEIRIEVDNPGLRLKPEMYAEVDLMSSLAGSRSVIPRSAVINSGTRQLAYLASGDGRYHRREIVTGVVGDNDMVEIRSGLDEGDAVVVSGQFLLDSESRLSEALASGVKVGHDHGSDQSEMSSTEDSEDHSGHGHAAMTTPTDEDERSGVYTCPMESHYHVLQYGEGKCSECNMALVPVEDTDNKNVYVCPMRECEIASHEEGRCPKCNMKLQKLDLGDPEEDSLATHEHATTDEIAFDTTELVAIGGHDIYTCPMPSHFHVLQYGEGNCSECNMKLVPLAETDNKNVYVCPMTECGTVQDHKGECPVCGMNLVRYQPEEDDDR
jgi:Cu(I)/Ag(I) efflux system membrane fusion protein/cobalt-zinc-cadmium efflux system membrane fusion protein